MSVFGRFFGVCAGVWLGVVLCCGGQDLFGDGDELTLEEPGSVVLDFDLLKFSHLSEVDGWVGVRGVVRGKPVKGDGFAWDGVVEGGYNHLKSFATRLRMTAQPVTREPIRSVMDVPKGGAYRVWLGYLATPGRTHALNVSLGEQTLVFNDKALSTSTTGAQVEKDRPVVLETDMARVGMLRQPLFVWEYRDVVLEAGRLDLALQAEPGKVRVDSLLVTQSKDFRPSKALQVESNTVSGTFYRFRVGDGVKGSFTFGNKMTYHRPHRVMGALEPHWYWDMERELGTSGVVGDAEGKPVAAGEWSRWLNASGSSLNGGPTATAVVLVKGMKGPGTIEVQLAWFPHEGAVLKSIELPVLAGRSQGIFMMPLYPYRAPTPSVVKREPVEDEEDEDEEVLPGEVLPVWGMRAGDWLARLRNAVQVAQEHQAVVDALDLPDGALARRLNLTTTMRTDPSAERDTLAMLRSMGFSHAGGPGKALLLEFGMRGEVTTHHNDILFHTKTHCPLDPLARQTLAGYFEKVAESVEARGWAREDVTVAKLGDEIGAIVSVGHINACTDCRRRFHRYLEEEYGGAEAFGEESLAGLGVSLDAGVQGVAERRLLVASQRFMFDFSAEFYKLVTEEMTAIMPNVTTYCNFSPHPVIFGGTMNHSDWFNLTRRGGTTMAWGEDWASMSSWGFWMGWQVVSYYGALVEAAAKSTNGHAGFYAVHGGAHQQFACIAKGIKNVLVYGYGPEYSLADGANAWSERYGRYGSIATGLRALGPADEIIADGEREQAKVGLLYNRFHEMWHEELGKLMQVERVGTLFALEHANCPAELVLEEDLLAGPIRHKAIYLHGFNISGELMEALRVYVEGGGTVVAMGATGRYDEYNSLQDTQGLLGVTWGAPVVATGGHAPNQLEASGPLDKVTFEGEFEGSLPVYGAKVPLVPVEGTKVLGRFADGSPAVVSQSIGSGKVVTWGLLPGASYRGQITRNNPDGGFYNTYRHSDAETIASPAVAACGERLVGYGHPLVELRRFDLDGRIAVTMNNFYYRELAEAELRVWVPAGQAVTRVSASLGGELAFSREGDWLTVVMPLPGEVDVVVVE